MENYARIAIPATNLKGNFDTAFARRLQVIVEFPFPGIAERERIWRRPLPEQVPQAVDVDLGVLAQTRLAGGSIKNCAVDDALAAAAEGKPVTMGHLVRAVAREMEKLGKPLAAAVFGPYAKLLR
ncbi:MAG: hypothetical protein GY835_09500 [bacterium]|nr:hypothetical protein [bacterium]